MNRRRRIAPVLVAVAVAQIGFSLLWLYRDTRPWIWDMSFHARIGLDYLDWLQDPSVEKLRFAYGESLQYPPLYHWVEALSYAVAGRFQDAAALPNFLFLGLMLWGALRLGERVGGANAGLWTALLLSFFPIVVWLSRVPLLDYALTAVVCVAFFFLLETENFSLTGRSMLFGVVCGLGMLTKWTFLFFLAAPTLFVFFQRRAGKERHRVLNLALTILAAAAVASVWYAVKLDYLLSDYLPRHTAEGAAEGDPSVPAPAAWLAYMQFLLSYQLFFPLAACVAIACAWAVRARRQFASLAVVWVWLAGAWLILTLLTNKDPRYSVPLLPAVALIAGTGLNTEGKGRRLLKGVTLVVAVAQFLVITFQVPLVPGRISLGAFHSGTYAWDWQLFSSTYSGFLGPARADHWPLDDVLAETARRGGGTLYIVPDHPYFSPETFLYEARLHRRPVDVRALRTGPLPAGRDGYLILKSGEQGDARTTAGAGQLSGIIRNDSRFNLLRRWPLPDGSEALLYGAVPQ